MDSTHPKQDRPLHEVICHCSGTTRLQILRYIEEGDADFASLSRRSGAGAGCGACETWILEMAAKHDTT